MIIVCMIIICMIIICMIIICMIIICMIILSSPQQPRGDQHLNTNIWLAYHIYVIIVTAATTR